MKNKLIFQLLTTSLFFSVNFLSILPLKAENILTEINRTGLLKVGIRSDAIPFGYRNNQSDLQGICFDLVSLIRENLRKNIDRNIITVKIVISNLNNRFHMVEDGIVHLECGPNTIRTLDNYKVSFSEPFFISGIQFITSKDKASKFINSDGKNLTIGLLTDTNTEIFIREKYPQATFQLFSGIRGSQRALQAVTQQRIDGFADDGVLLIGQSVAQQIFIGNNSDYVLTPQPPLTCEKYGLIIPENDSSWENFINSLLKSEEKSQIINNWFSNFSNKVSFTDNICD